MLQPESQRRMVLVIVSIALLLDNMLYMVIVPIIPDYLRTMDVLRHKEDLLFNISRAAKLQNNTGKEKFQIIWPVPEAEDAKIGTLFAFKAIVQLFFNPLTGHIIDRVGYDIPMVIGLSVIFISTSIFAFGHSFGVMFTARGLQGVGSAFADTSGLAMIADRYTEENERTMALGIALAFISFGSLFAPPFGGVLYQYCGKEFPFIALAFLALFDGFLVMFIMKPVRLVRMELKAEGALPKPVPIHRLLRDPYILICAGALVSANISLAFLEPTIAIWMQDTMQATNSQAGLIWLPSFLPHVLGVYTTVKLAEKYPQYQWLMAAIGLLLEGISCLFIPLCGNFVALMIPICVLCYGIALVDTAILPCLGYLVDTRFVSVYGSVYAIADISYCVAYAIGPIVAGNLMSIMNFMGLNTCICIITCAYTPLLYILRKSRVSDEERNKKMGIIDEGENEEQLEALDGIKDLKSQDSMNKKSRLKRQETARFEPAGCRRATSISNEFAMRVKQLSMECPGYEQGEALNVVEAKQVYVADGSRGVVLNSQNTSKLDGSPNVYTKDKDYGY
nr:vesicular acetylcholine transporter [Hymenolepis microstoma]